LSGAQAVNFAYECNNPATCSASNLMSVNGGAATTIARNNNGSVGSYTPVNMSFDGNGNAPFTFNYSDVGQVKLWASKTVDSAMLAGSSNAFVVKPGGFTVSNPQRTADNFANPGALNANDPMFIKAGNDFTATVTATTTPASGATTTPNYGRETVPESVKLTPTLVAPAGGITGTLTGAFGAFSNGVATGTAFTWNEVGIITLTPSVGDADYLGAGDTAGTVSGNVGRFVPDHFTLSAASLANRNGACTPASTFTYLGEELNLVFTLTAEKLGGGTTQNYDSTLGGGGFAKLTPGIFANYGVGARSGATNLTSRTSGSVSGAPVWASGVLAGLTAQATVARAASPDGPWTATRFGVDPTDSDGTRLPTSAFNLDVNNDSVNEHQTIGTATELRFGRLRLMNTYGSELLDIRVPLRAEYYNGGGWNLNTDDSCTAIPLGAVALGNRTPPGIGSSPSAVQVRSPGVWDIVLAKPTSAGSIDITLNLAGSTAAADACLAAWVNSPDASTNASLAFLTSKWCGAAYDKIPIARLRFGSPKASYIYLRERY